MGYPLKPPTIEQKYWDKFYTQWKHIFSSEHGGYKFKRWRNTEVLGLERLTGQGHYHGAPVYQVWCSSEQASKWAFYTQIKKYATYPIGTISSKGLKLIRDQIKVWKGKEKPVPPPPVIPPVEPEPEPDPVDDGNGWLDGAATSMKQWIKEAILAGLAFLDKPLSIIKDMVAKLGQTIAGIVSAVESAISTVMAKVVGMFEIVVERISGVINDVWNNIQQLWETLRSMFKTIKQAVVTAIETSWTFIKKTFTVLWEKMKDGLTYIGNRIVDGIKYLWDKIKNALNWTWNLLKSAYTAIVDTVTAVWNRFKERLTDTIKSIKVAFGDAIDRLTEWWESYMNWRDKNTENLQNWSEEKLTDTIKFMVRIQRRVIEELAKEFK